MTASDGLALSFANVAELWETGVARRTRGMKSAVLPWARLTLQSLSYFAEDSDQRLNIISSIHK